MIAKVLMIVLIFALIILVHEYGHYIAAKKMGVRVNEFAIGMGPKLWSITKGETMYSIRLLPIGGFCSMEGESEDSDNPRAMNKKKPWQRLVIFAAGAVMNFILAWIFVALIIGVRGYGTTTIERVEEGMPAYEIGLQAGDKILSINGKEVKELTDISIMLQGANQEEKSYTILVERADKTQQTLEIKSRWLPEENRARFGFTTTRNHWNILRNIGSGFTSTINMIKQVLGGLVEIVTGKVAVDDLAGIVGIAQISSDAWNEGIKISLWSAIENMIFIGAILSSNLAVMNLLPLPALDGGRILFTLIEIIRGKAISPDREASIHFMGFVLLMGLMVFILYNDIMRIVR